MMPISCMIYYLEKLCLVFSTSITKHQSIGIVSVRSKLLQKLQLMALNSHRVTPE